MFDPLILDPAPESLWLAFQTEPRALDGRGGIVEQWRRSLRLGAPADGVSPEQALERGASLRDRIAHLDPLLARGANVLARVAEVAHRHDYSLLVADADGVVVQAHAGGAFADEARRVRLIEGAHWSEGMRGTNAIGTAIAERRPVFVRGTSHYGRPYQGLVCYAAPVRDPDGRIVAVLDATSAFERDDRSMGFGIVAAAHALEELLRVQSYEQAGAQVRRTVARTLDHLRTPAVLIEPPDRIARCNEGGRALLGRRGTAVGVRSAFGVDFAQLVELAGQGPLALRLFSDQVDVRVEVEPIESEGRCIAALVLLERATAAGPAIATTGVRTEEFAELFTQDDATRAALAFARRIAPSELPVMLLAETGAGKELVAQGIHRASGRGHEPFVAVNCGSIQASLLESELFGYGPGAFTGAERRGHDGYLAAAGAGTLFLDEVAEMPLAMQAALLRVLETRTFRRVGETELRTAGCRIVCATCRDLPAMVEQGSFRRDLYYRLKGATVSLPALRERTDVIALAEHLLSGIAAARGLQTVPTIRNEVARVLAQDPWPGNVRELKTTLEVAVVLADGANVIDLQHLPEERRRPPAARPDAAPQANGLADAEADAVRRALRMTAGNISRAAQALGVARSTLYRMIRRHGIAARDDGSVD